MSISDAPSFMASSVSATCRMIWLLPCGKLMTEQTSTAEPDKTSAAIGTEYGFTQAVATSYFFDSSHPARTCASVIVGWRSEWSIILLICWAVTLVFMVWCW